MYFLIALIPALLYGSMGVILMKLGGDSRQQTMGMAGGALVVSVLTAFLGLDLRPQSVAVALLAGVTVGVAIYFQLQAFHKIGVSRVMPLTTGGQLLGISLLGILLFGEWRGTAALPVGLCGLALIIVGVLLTTWEDRIPASVTQDAFAAPYDPVAIVDSAVPVRSVSAGGEAKGAPALTAMATAPVRTTGSDFDPNKSRPDQWGSGLVDTVISTVLFIAFPIIIRYWDVDPLGSFLFQAIGLSAAAIILTFPVFTPSLGTKDTRWSKFSLRALIPGAMWGAGVVIMQFSQVTVGVAVGFSLSQLSVIFSTFGGIWLLGERRTRKEMVAITIGIVLLVAGALILGVAKTLDVA